MIFLEIPGKEGSCCVSRRSVSSCFEAVVNPLGRASVNSEIAEAVIEFLSESQQHVYPHLQGAACKGKSLSFNTLKSFGVRQCGTQY